MSSENHWFLTLDKRSDWEQGLLSVNLQITDAGISPEQSVDYQLQQTLDLDSILDGAEVCDLAADRCGLLFLLDDRERVWVIDPDQGLAEPVIWDGLFKNPVGLAVTPDTLYLADANPQSQAAIFAFARINWQIRWTVTGAAEGARLIPADLATDARENLYMLDRTNHEIVKIDLRGQIPDRYDLKPWSAQREWIGMAVFKSTLFVLNMRTTDKHYLVLRLDLINAGIEPDFIDITDSLGVSFSSLIPSSLCTDEEGNIFIGDLQMIPIIPGSSGTNEDMRFIHKFSPGADGAYAYMGVVSGHRGPVNKMAVGAGDQIYVYYKNLDGPGAKQIDTLSPINIPLPTGAYSYFSRAFDSTISGTVWHKLVLDAEIPDNTQVRLSYIISDDYQVVALAGGVSPEKQLQHLSSLDWSSPLVNPRDALVSGTGRYLWLKMEMVVTGSQVPLVTSIRLSFPRQSYLRYLPAVYQQDAQSKAFLERFLSLFETMLDDLEYRIDHLARYCDVAAVTGDDAGSAFLHWLASWLAIVVDENWTDGALRNLVQQAPDLYRKRGTPQGIEEMVKLYTGCQPFIFENFQLNSIYELYSGSDPVLPYLYNTLYSTQPFSFCVLLPPFRPSGNVRFDDNDIATVGRILEQEAPAHTRPWLVPLQPWVILGWHTYLEVNTYLSEPLLLLDGGRSMPLDTVITDVEEAGQIERRSRLGMDTNLS